jgi:hypothetical protein
VVPVAAGERGMDLLNEASTKSHPTILKEIQLLKKFILSLALTSIMFAQADAKDSKKAPEVPKPTAEEILTVKNHVTTFYRLNNQLTALQAQAESERSAAQAAAKVIEAKYNCTYDLDSDMCAAKAAPEAKK